MPPKKPVPGQKGQPTKVETQQCGLFWEHCPLPVWDDEENLREAWGDLNATGAIDAASLFVDPDWQTPHVASFGAWLGDWKRPSSIFSPFKPVVYRPVFNINPYEWDPAKPGAVLPTSPSSTGPQLDDEDAPKLTTKAEVIAHYRAMKPVRLHSADETPSLDLNGTLNNLSMASPNRRMGAKKTAGRSQSAVPLMTRVLNSALMVLNQSQSVVPQGHYAWELIYPQNPATGFPVYNPHGKYAVKLFIGGAYRRILIDDRLPVDVNGQCMLTVTEQKEVWPALLAKAMLKALVGVQLEKFVFKNPAWVLNTLLGGWIPQVLSPSSDELQTLRTIRQTMASRQLNGVHIGDPVLIATCADSADPEFPIPETDDHYLTNAGFHPNQAFHVLDMRSHHNTSLLRLCAPGANWKGPFHYGSNSWTEMESSLGFTQNDRNQADLNRKWLDFWIPWEQFLKYFNSVVVLRKVVEEKRFSVYRHILPPPDPPLQENTKGAAKNANAAAAAANPAQPVVERGLPKNLTKWLYINSDTPTKLLVTVVGLAKTREKDGNIVPYPPTTVTFHSYHWTRSVPFSFVSKTTIHCPVTQSVQVPIPAGPAAYRIAIESLPQDCVLALMSSCEMTVGEEREICKDLLEVTTSSDAGIYGECKADNTTVWFKRSVTVKQPTKCNFFLSTLPKTADLAQFRTVAVDAPAGKGKPPPKPAKGGKGDTGAQELNPDDLDDGETGHSAPIMEFASLSVLNADTSQVIYEDTIGKILGATLQPNKLGYIIVATATPKGENYGKGLWRLLTTSDRPFETFEPRLFDESFTKTGEYVHNDVSSLLRYNFTVGEPATAALQLRVKDATGIPFTLELFHNEKLLEKRTGVGSCFFPHLALQPAPDKTTQSVYAVHVTLDSRYTQTWEDQRREHIVVQWEKDCREQEQHLLGQQAELRELLKKDPNAATAGSQFSGPRPGTVVTHSANIAYTLNIVASTPKLELKEDNSINEQITAIKASWSKPKDSDVPEPQGKGKAAAPKPAKGQPVVDEATIRFQKAKESRDKYLMNRKGIFIPYNNNGKVVLNAEDEPAGRMIPMAPPQPHNGTVRIHEGVGASGGLLVGGIIKPVDSQQSEAASHSEAAVQRPNAQKLLEDIQADLAARREQRKQLYGEFSMTNAAFWGITKPEAKPETNIDEEAKRKQSKVKK
jgi:hypothetical protein